MTVAGAAAGAGAGAAGWERPWMERPLPGGFDHPTMLTRDEIDCLHWLGSGLAGAGRIVEVGCFLGGSTRALLAGVEAGGAGRLPIISHDRFVVERRSQSNFLRHLRAGESFRDLHARLMAPWADRVLVRAGDVPEDAGAAGCGALYPEGEPIELLFLDFAGRPGLHRTALRAFGRHLTPGIGVLVEQDFQYGRLHWIALHAWAMRDVLEPWVDVGDAATNVLRVTGSVSRALEGLPVCERMDARAIDAAWREAGAYFRSHGWRAAADTAPQYRANHLASNGLLAEAAGALESMWRGDAPIEPFGLRPTVEDLRARLTADERASAGGRALVRAMDELLGATRALIDERESDRQRRRAEWYRDRLWDDVERRLLGRGEREVVLFGAGRHARDVLGSGWPRRGLRVAAIVDDAPAVASIDGVPVVGSGVASVESLPGVVVVCSDAHEGGLLASARRVFGSEREIVAPYGGAAGPD